MPRTLGYDVATLTKEFGYIFRLGVKAGLTEGQRLGKKPRVATKYEAHRRLDRRCTQALWDYLADHPPTPPEPLSEDEYEEAARVQHAAEKARYRARIAILVEELGWALCHMDTVYQPQDASTGRSRFTKRPYSEGDLAKRFHEHLTELSFLVDDLPPGPDVAGGYGVCLP